jgi:hypothetical protein
VTARAQAGGVKTLLSKVTAPLRASALPSTVEPVSTVMDSDAMMFPLKLEPVPNVAELPTCQNTWQGCASLIMLMRLLEAVVKVLPIWKTNVASRSPSASNVTPAPNASELGKL